MNTRSYRSILLLGLLSLCLLATDVYAVSASDYSQLPPILIRRQTPLVMFGLSVDEQLFFRAYSDYSDIDGDGNLDLTYKDTFNYYGYFESDWCYQYNSGSGYFEPENKAAGTNGHSCKDSDGAHWSGNFLNWATMTRMDVLRKVLYGGKRYLDTSSATVLERAYIPDDMHAFAKVYSGSDLGDYTPYGSLSALTMCNVSSSPSPSSSAPQLRLAAGAWPHWAITEGQGCQWDKGDNIPSASSELNKGSENQVRVAACVAGKDALTASSCETYKSGDSKPVGLLQRYGEDGSLKFGLISGSFDKYISGGTLRKNIGLIASNTDPTKDELSLTDGTFNSSVYGIINTLDSIHIINWNGSKYDYCNQPGISISAFKSGATYQCRDWGNPVSEIYLEALRYFAGATDATSAFVADDTPYISTLKTATWPSQLSANPLSTDNACANCSIIMISSGVNSFDGDELSSVSSINSLTVSGINAETDLVGQKEYGTFPLSFLSGGGTDDLCSPKSLSGLSGALGICPESPALEGTYAIAGLAYYGKTHDLRPDLSGSQTIDTYGVDLAESVPSFEIPVGGGKIRFLPACESNHNGNATVTSSGWLPCRLYDVEVLNLTKDANGNLTSGRLVFYWEDSPWGNDSELDGSQVVSFCVGSACKYDDTRPNSDYDDVTVGANELRISQGVGSTAAGFALRFGYDITGASSGNGAPSGSEWLLRPGNQNENDLYQLSSYEMPMPTQSGHTYYPKSRYFAAGTSNEATLLEKPLWLAAKYGGFNDMDGSGDPIYTDPQTGSKTSTREWDILNNRTGASGPDGVPDNYFFASNPSLLVNQMQRVFESLVAHTSSGTNAAVVANSSTGIGAVYQALYQPRYTVGASQVTWTGTLRALFIDQNGNIREDTNQNGQLDDTATDYRLVFKYTKSTGETTVDRYSMSAGATTWQYVDTKNLNEIKPIWSAVDRLAKMQHPEEQRTYASTSGGNTTSNSQSADNKRYILTAMDRNGDGEVNEKDVVAFTPSVMQNADSQYYQYLGMPDTTTATTLINYIRGQEQSGLRNRSIDIDGNGTLDVWRLGDIIHSTPAVVATPNDQYNVKYNDTTYQAFVTKYLNRRQMIYVGANDGMLHAFNGGFWDAANKKFGTTSVNGSETAFPLGQEMWAYVPENLLPHLRWLAAPDYPHVYYVDGEPETFDVNAWPANDTVHVDGWGTILVVGMRQGGAPITETIDGQSKTFRSAYIIMDVTDPESPPTLLGEITLPDDMGLTFSKPVLVKRRAPDSTGDWSKPSVNKWDLVIGTGPTGSNALTKGESSSDARLYAIDLQKLVQNATGSSTSYLITMGANSAYGLDTGVSNSFVGGLTSVDWNNDYSDDALYVGLTAGTEASPSGRIMRYLIDDNDGSVQVYYGLGSGVLGTLLNPGKPFQANPITTRDANGERWILEGSGRQFVPGDNSNTDQQYFYGVKEPRNSSGALTYSSVTDSSLIDTTDIAVFSSSGTVKDVSSGTLQPLSINGTTVTDYSQLQTVMQSEPGWKIRMHKPINSSGGALASGKVIRDATINPANVGEFAFTEYLPPADSCEFDGISYLYELGLTTGTATPDASLGTSTSYVNNQYPLSLSNISLGSGQASSVTFHQGSGGQLNALTNMSTSEIKTTQVKVVQPKSGRQSWRQIDTTTIQ
ncbi:pilus assembly protein [Mangrovitalea sediminis]|uniref:pilus assembly protein n=1 Tax=Mangrovitalea sediminis TaxID=1982043 RepID=UPI000BE5CE02|nr:PilC/PilY family type IV pilus protein [Mangrovitalea sediminis]